MNERLEVVLEPFKQELLLEFFYNLQVFDLASLFQHLLDQLGLLFTRWSPLVDCIQHKQIFFTFGQNGGYHVLAGLVEMEIAEQRSRFEIDVGVPHLPNGDGPSFEVGFNSILIVLVIQSGSATNVRHRLKHGTLYSSIRQVLLEVAIDQRLEVDLLGEVWAQLNFVDGIGHAVESADNYILFAGHDVGPRVDVV